jgi:hypothetical protein
MDDGQKSPGFSVTLQCTVTVNSSDTASTFDNAVFTILYPLYHQVARPSPYWSFIFWLIEFVELMAISFFRIDRVTFEPTPLSLV